MQEVIHAGSILLFQDAAQGNVEAVKTALSGGFDVNDVDENQMSALHHAANSGAAELMKMLIEAEADLEATDIFGARPLDLAADKGHLLACRVLLYSGSQIEKQGGGGSALHYGIHHVKIVRLLLEYGAQIQATEENLASPLHVAAEGGHLHTLALLLERNADKEAVDVEGRTALHCASIHGHMSAVRLLLNEKADPMVRTNAGWLASDLAIKETIKEVLVEAELEHGGRGDKKRRSSVTFSGDDDDTAGSRRSSRARTETTGETETLPSSSADRRLSSSSSSSSSSSLSLSTRSRRPSRARTDTAEREADRRLSTASSFSSLSAGSRRSSRAQTETTESGAETEREAETMSSVSANRRRSTASPSSTASKPLAPHTATRSSTRPRRPPMKAWD